MNVPIVYCLDKKFVKFTKISLASLLKHNPDADIHLIVPEYLEELSNYKQHICSEEKLDKTYIRDYDRMSMFTYARLYIPELLSEYDKCLYIDGDIIIRTKLDELLNTDVEYIGAVEDNFPGWLLNGIEKDIYYNAGVLLLNLKNLREDNFTEKTLDYITHHKERYVGKEETWLHDQTTINALYSEKITPLDKKWNDQLAWNPPTEYKNIVEEETNLHFLTDYNKSSFVKYVIDRYKDYPLFAEETIDIILILSNDQKIQFINDTIKSVLNQTYDNYKFHIFVKYRNIGLDSYFNKLESDKIKLYDVSNISLDKDVLEYAKSKITAKYITIIDENILLIPDALKELLIHYVRYNSDFVISRSRIFGDIHNEIAEWPYPNDSRTETLLYSYIREGSLFCESKYFKDFDFSKSLVYPFHEFVNSLILNADLEYSVTYEINEYYRDYYFNRMRFYDISEEMTWLVKRSFKRLGFDINFNEARHLNPYYTYNMILTKEELHHLRYIRRQLELMEKPKFNGEMICRMFGEI